MSVLSDAFWSRFRRACGQRMYLIGQQIDLVNSPDSDTDEKTVFSRNYQVQGSTGNPYEVIIGNRTSCTCMDFQRRRRTCKHIIFIKHRVLNISTDDENLDKLNMSSAYLRTLFERADQRSVRPDLLLSSANGASKVFLAQPDSTVSREEITECHECVICFESITKEDDEQNELVWCRRQCGKILHRECWLQLKRTRGNPPCPFCRTMKSMY
jgi:uncharacterized Zn finger protein